MRTLLLLCFALCIAAQPAFGQEVDVDALVAQQKLAQQHKADSLKQLSFDSELEALLNLRDLIRIYRDVDIDSALAYSDKELALAKSLNNPDQLAIARINASTLREQVGKYEEVIALLLQNRDAKASLHDSLVAHTESSLSLAYLDLGEFDKAISTGVVAANYFEKIADSVNAGFCYIIIGNIYSRGLDNHTEAAHYVDEALRQLETQHGPREYLINALLIRADLHIELQEYDLAVQRYAAAQQEAIAHGQLVFLPSVLFGLGKASYYTGQHEQSLGYLQEAIGLPNANMQVDIQLNKYLGLNYQKLDQPEQAIPHFELCLKQSLEAGSRNQFSGYLVACYRELGDYQTALKLQQAITARQDSLNEIEQTEKVAAIIEQYEGEKKQLKIERLHQENAAKEARIAKQNVAIWSIVALFVLLGLGGWLWLRVRQKLKESKAQMANANLRQRFLRTQLNPHFFFHALSSIEGYIYANEREPAAQFLRNFSKLMRSILESSDQDFIAMEQDLDMLRQYLSLQQLNSDFRFEYVVNVSEALQGQGLKIPPMLIQPAVENAILHGALNTENGLVQIDCTREGDRLHIRIADNGPGVSSDQREANALHRSMSTDIVKERIQNLQALHGIEIRYTIEANHSSGTAVVFDLPLLKNIS